MKLDDCDKVTRVEVIDRTGRVFVSGSYKTEAQIQDNGLTLKVFIDARPYSGVLQKEQSH